MSSNLSQSAIDRIWFLLARVRDVAEQAGIFRALEPSLLTMAHRLIAPSKEEMEVLLPSGNMLMVPPGYTAGRNLKTATYERELTDVLKTLLTGGMNFVDTGASIGYYTLLSSALVGRFGCVYAFEPDPRNYRYLARNVSENHLHNVKIAEKAVAARSGRARFVVDAHGAEGFVSDRPDRFPSIEIQTIALDDFFRLERWPPIDVVKMDIEGNESAALLGMKELSKRNPRLQIALEYSPRIMRRAGVSPEKLISTLLDLGFRTVRTIEKNMKVHPLADWPPQKRACNLLVRK